MAGQGADRPGLVGNVALFGAVYLGLTDRRRDFRLALVVAAVALYVWGQLVP